MRLTVVRGALLTALAALPVPASPQSLPATVPAPAPVPWTRGILPNGLVVLVAERPGVTAPIVGASKPHHLDDAVAALSLGLTSEEIAGLDALYVPHGVDTTLFKPRPEIRDAVRDELGIPREAFLVGMVAANKGNPSRARARENVAVDSKMVRPERSSAAITVERGKRSWRKPGTENARSPMNPCPEM